MKAGKRLFLVVSGLLVLGLCLGSAQKKAKAEPRPEWNQKKAEAIVQGVIDLEKTGQPWDQSAWTTNPSVAVTRAKQENKPIFVFFFLKKNVGPAAAPC